MEIIEGDINIQGTRERVCGMRWLWSIIIGKRELRIKKMLGF